MNKHIKRGVALALTMALMLAAAPFASASEALGTELRENTVTLAQNATAVNQSLWSATYSDLRTENYVTYSSGSVTPMVYMGTYVNSKTKLTTLARQLEAKGYRVVAGINGGYYNTTSGAPVGLVITDGAVQSTTCGGDGPSVGFSSDGSAFVASPGLTVFATVGVTTVKLSGINKSRENNGFYLFTENYGATTKNTVQGVDVILKPLSTTSSDGSLALKIGSTLTLQVVSKRTSTPDNSIPDGCYVLSVNNNSNADKLALLNSLVEGDTMTVSISASDTRWNSVSYAVSGLYQIIKDGAVVSTTSSAAPRTAVGVKSDGSIVLYTVDGRQSGYSVGATIDQVAARLKELGCTSALCLDGGGSTMYGVTTPGSSTFAVTNSPSDGSERAVSNGLFLVSSAAATGTLGSLYLSCANDVVLAGGSVTLNVSGTDTNYYPTALSGDVTWSAQNGSVAKAADGSYVYTAGTAAGTDTITASCGGKTGTMTLRVVTDPGAVSVFREDTGSSVSSLALKVGATVDLAVFSSWYNLQVGGSAGGAVWNVSDPLLGAIDQNGLFTAGTSNTSGTITVTCGAKSTAVTVKVSRDDPFQDTGTHWARDYITKLYTLGVVTGVTGDDGLYYYPNNYITRGEFLAMVCRLLKVNTDSYSAVVLPFEDASSISSWMLPYVKAMYATGVFSGSQKGGKLYAETASTITREAAMTIIGRTIVSDASSDLAAFTDASSVSSWAKPNVQKLVGLGVVSGGDGLLNPKAAIKRGEMAKILAVASDLDMMALPTPAATVTSDTAPVSSGTAETASPETATPETVTPSAVPETSAPVAVAPDAESASPETAAPQA